MSAYLAMYLLSNILIQSIQWFHHFLSCLSVFVDKIVQCLFRQLITLSLRYVYLLRVGTTGSQTTFTDKDNLFQHFVIHDERE